MYTYTEYSCSNHNNSVGPPCHSLSKSCKERKRKQVKRQCGTEHPSTNTYFDARRKSKSLLENDGDGGWVCWRVGNVTSGRRSQNVLWYPRFLPFIERSRTRFRLILEPSMSKADSPAQHPSAMPVMYAASRLRTWDGSRKEYASAYRHALSSL